MSLLLLFRPSSGVTGPPNCTSQGSGNSQDATFGLPGCADLETVIFCIIGESSQTANFISPTGWTKIIDQDADDAGGASLNVFWRGGISPGSGPVTFTRDAAYAGVPWAGGLVVFDGFSTSDPIVALASDYFSTTSPSTRDIEATAANQLILAAFSARCSTGTDWTSPADMTERWDEQYGSNEVGVGLDWDLTDGAGSIGSRTASFTAASNHGTVGVWIVGFGDEFDGPETTDTWRDLLREAKDPPYTDGIRLVPWPIFIRRNGNSD